MDACALYPLPLFATALAATAFAPDDKRPRLVPHRRSAVPVRCIGGLIRPPASVVHSNALSGCRVRIRPARFWFVRHRRRAKREFYRADCGGSGYRLVVHGRTETADTTVRHTWFST